MQESKADLNSVNPLVSIILPTYNGAKYLRQAILSCLNQSFNNIELIVVVDGSTDDTDKVLAEFTDPRVQIVHHQKNLGLPEGLNTGFAHSQGDFLTWTSDDNWYSPNAITTMVNFLTENVEIGFVYADMWLVDETGGTQTLDVLPPEHLRNQPWNGIYACFMYSRTVYETVGDYDPTTRLAEDYDYWLRIAAQHKIAALHQRLYYYRQHNSSLTGVHGRYAASRQILRVRRKNGWIGYREYLYWSAFLDIDAAFWHNEQNEKEAVRKMGLRGLVKNPKNLRNVGLLSILTEAFLGVQLTNFLRHQLRRRWI
jgi:glycosyltransferase involved in cell wall biosynthesis